MPHHQVIELDPDEELLFTVTKTPWGLIPVIGIGALVFIGMLVAVGLIARFQDLVNFPVPVWALLSLTIVLTVLTVIMTVIAVLIYINSRMFVTSERIINFIQHALFKRQASQLSLANIQEVTVKQHNIFQTLLNFGSIRIETAGEMDNFTFKLARNPYRGAREIDNAKEAFVGNASAGP
ncbi:PH domain-containing protein [Candidatus Microgenomates bacterium]|nr:PH domain-containing protein [Candidatus Microgenomates bacterium]